MTTEKETTNPPPPELQDEPEPVFVAADSAASAAENPTFEVAVEGPEVSEAAEEEVETGDSSIENGEEVIRPSGSMTSFTRQLEMTLDQSRLALLLVYTNSASHWAAFDLSAHTPTAASRGNFKSCIVCN